VEASQEGLSSVNDDDDDDDDDDDVLYLNIWLLFFIYR
jgi:hypothetical protein